MKSILALALGWGLVVGVARSQEFVVSPPTREISVVAPSVAPRPSVEGIVKEIFETKKPWQLVNPLAPKSDGVGGPKTVSYSERDPGKPKGFILFALEW